MSTPDLIIMASGSFNIVMALWMHTSNFRSALLFKIIPFFLGLGCLGVAFGLFDV